MVERYPRQAKLLALEDNTLFGSAASIWEMSIKLGVGKLELDTSLTEFIAYLTDFNLTWLPVAIQHAANPARPEPFTRDPFDRMLLAQCAVEGMKLVTVDKLLTGHPLVLSA